MIDYKYIGARIRAIRMEKKITQEQLAEAVGVGTSHISHIETGNGTFMQHHNPEQFEIIGLGTGEIAKSLGVTKNYRGRTDISYQRKDGTFTCPYERVLIRNLHPEEAK